MKKLFLGLIFLGHSILAIPKFDLFTIKQILKQQKCLCRQVCENKSQNVLNGKFSLLKTSNIKNPEQYIDPSKCPVKLHKHFEQRINKSTTDTQVQKMYKKFMGHINMTNCFGQVLSQRTKEYFPSIVWEIIAESAQNKRDQIVTEQKEK